MAQPIPRMLNSRMPFTAHVRTSSFDNFFQFRVLGLRPRQGQGGGSRAMHGSRMEAMSQDQKSRELDFEQFLELITVRNDSKTIRVRLGWLVQIACASYRVDDRWPMNPHLCWSLECRNISMAHWIERRSICSLPRFRDMLEAH